MTSDKLTLEPAQYSLWWPIAGLAAILCITFYPYLFGGKILLPTDMYDTMTAPSNAQYGPPQAQDHYFYDALAQGYPYKIRTEAGLRSGTLAYWDPHVLGGYPAYAETLAGNFDVFNVLGLWLGPLELITTQIIIEMMIAGLGLFFLLSFFRVERLVALLFSSAFMLNSMFILSIANRWSLGSFCWVPFTTLMSMYYLRDRRNIYLIFASIFLCLSFLGGTFQSSFFCSFIAVIIFLFYPSSKSFLSRIAAVGCVGIAAFLLSAIMWLPSLELFLRTLYRGGALNSTSVYAKYTVIQRLLSLPLAFVYFHFPGIAGGPKSFSLKIGAHVDICDFNGAIGFLPALFSFWGCIALRKELKLRPFLVLSACGLLLPIITPLYAILYHRFFLVASFGLCVVGAVAFQSVLDHDAFRSKFKKYLRRAKAALASLIVVLSIACLYITVNLGSVTKAFTKAVAPMILSSAQGVGNESWLLGRVSKTLQYYTFGSLALWGPILLAVSIIIFLDLYYAKKIKKQPFLFIMLVGSTAQLMIFAISWLPSINPEQFPLSPQNGITTFLRNDPADSRYAVLRDTSKDPYILPSNSSDFYRINDFTAYESLTPPSMSVFYHRDVPKDSLDLRLLGLANVKYVLARSQVIQTTDAHKVFYGNGITIYENMLCKPRAYLVHQCTIVNTDTEISAHLLRKDFDGSIALFAKQDVPENISISQVGQDSMQSERDSVQVTRSENEEVDISVSTRAKGILILTDTYYPGWKCYANGQKRELCRADGYMRAVMVDPGHSTIVFRFEPDIFIAGATTSAASALFCLGAIAFLNVRNRNKIVDETI